MLKEKRHTERGAWIRPCAAIGLVLVLALASGPAGSQEGTPVSASSGDAASRPTKQGTCEERKRQLGPAGWTCSGQVYLFADGFESANTSAWSDAIGEE